MSFNISKFIDDLAERAISTGWQAAAAYAIAQDVLHNVAYAVPIAAGLSVAKSLLVKFYQSNAEAQKIEKQVAPVVHNAISVAKDVAPIVAPVVDAVDPAAAPVVNAVEAAITK